jgi:hypothetical protein
MPSRPGEALTSSTSGPWLERSRSTPATFSPMARAARTAVARSVGVSLTFSACRPGAGWSGTRPAGPVRSIAATTLPPTTKQRRSVPLASAMNSCTRMFVEAPERLDHALRRLARLGQHHADALGALEQLDHQRRPPTMSSRSSMSSGGVREAGHRQADALARQQLQERSLSRAGDGDRLVDREDAHHLELAQHRRAVEGDPRRRCAGSPHRSPVSSSPW